MFSLLSHRLMFQILIILKLFAHSYFVGKLKAWVHNPFRQEVPRTSLLNGKNFKEFTDEITLLSSGERVEGEFTNSFRAIKNNEISKINNRDVYMGRDGNLYALDTQHGRFEVLDSKRGTHLGEVDFGLNMRKNPDPSKKHNLIVK